MINILRYSIHQLIPSTVTRTMNTHQRHSNTEHQMERACTSLHIRRNNQVRQLSNTTIRIHAPTRTRKSQVNNTQISTHNTRQNRTKTNSTLSINRHSSHRITGRLPQHANTSYHSLTHYHQSQVRQSSTTQTL